MKVIMERSSRIRDAREKKSIRALSGTVLALFSALIFAILSFVRTGIALPEQSDLGAFLISSEAGLYILTAVIGFTAGIAVAILIKKYKANR